MRTGLVLGSILVAGLGLASGATAHDDCQVATAAGFYARLCLLEDHRGSPMSWNTPASVSASQGGPYPGHDVCQNAPGPGLYARACADQSTYDTMSCSGGTCYGYRSGGTGMHAQAGGPFGETYLGVQQGAGEQRGSWGWQRSENTEATLQLRPLGQRLDAQGQQSTQESAYGRSCENLAYAWAAGSYQLVRRPCAEPTPAGAVDTHIPMVHPTCVEGPTGPLCGTFPDWPDGSGLPFL